MGFPWRDIRFGAVRKELETVETVLRGEAGDPKYSAWLNGFIADYVSRPANQAGLRSEWPTTRYFQHAMEVLSLTYTQEVTREFGGRDLRPVQHDEAMESLLSWYSWSGWVDSWMYRLDMLANACNSSLAWLHWSPAAGRPTVWPMTLAGFYGEWDRSNPRAVDWCKQLAHTWGCVEVRPGYEVQAWALYERRGDGRVTHRDLTDAGETYRVPMPSVLPDYPFVRLDFVPGETFLQAPSADWIEPMKISRRIAQLNLSMKFQAFPPYVHKYSSGESGRDIDVSPGSIVDLPIGDDFQQMESRIDYLAALEVQERQLALWARRRHVPPEEYAAQSNLTSGIARRVAREPLDRHRLWRQARLANFEADLFERYIRMHLGCVEELGLEQGELEATMRRVLAEGLRLLVSYSTEDLVEGAYQRARAKETQVNVVQEIMATTGEGYDGASAIYDEAKP